METLVSYKGGKPWRETLKELLAPVNLAAREQGTTVTVSRASAVAATAPDIVAAQAPVVDSGPFKAADTNRQALAVSPVADVPSVNVASADGWTADRGETLRKVLAEWCKRSRVELQWLAEYDYPMEASAHFSGSFEDAVRNLLAGFESARPQPVAELHTNPIAGQSLLVVQVRGNSYSN